MSNKGNKEIEIQVQIENSAKLKDFLKKEAEFVGKNLQIDTYYTLKHRDFLKVRPVTEWLRLRNSDGKYSVNYKKWHYDESGRSHYSDEYETEVGDIKQVENIFKVIDIRPVVVVKKVRQIYNYKDYEISIDNIKGLGDFVEIEYKGKNTELKPESITKKMVSFLKDLNCGKISRNYVGYPFQLLFPKEVVYEEV